MSLEDQEKIEKIATFIRHLINAGVSTEKAMERSFDYAMETSGIRHGRMMQTREEQMELAAKRLEAAAKQVGIHLDQQRAAMEKKG